MDSTLIRHHSRTVLYIHFALFAAILCAYAGVVNCGFINVDDPGYVYLNPFVRSGLSWENIRTAFVSFRGSLWIPLTWLSFMVDVSLFGLSSALFHFENVLWHAAAAMLLFHGLRKATGHLWPSAIVAALFGLHPINVESVAWITERKNVLCAFFWILSMNAYFRYGITARVRSYWLALAWFAMALMAKPMAVTLPATLLLLDLWPLRRDLSRWWRLLLEKVPFFLLAAAACLLALHAPQGPDVQITAAELPVIERLSNAAASYLYYLRDFVWPLQLSAFYPYPVTPRLGLAAIALIVLLSITAAVTWCFRSRRYLLVGWFWFLGTLVPMLGLVQVGPQARADRFTYIAQIGLFIAAVWGVVDSGNKRQRRLAAVSVTAVLVVLCVQTAAEVQYWTNTTTLFERAIETTPPNMFARVVAARARASQGDHRRAAEHFQVALQIDPLHADLWRDYGRTLQGLGNSEGAARAFAIAARLNSKDGKPTGEGESVGVGGVKPLPSAKRGFIYTP